jgi:exodeoxyribonuclease VII small subunit
MNKKPEADLESITYEQAFKELEEIVASLETNQQSLEESMRLYERGQQLSKYCADLLEKAELKIQQLSGANPATREN